MNIGQIVPQTFVNANMSLLVVLLCLISLSILQQVTTHEQSTRKIEEERNGENIKFNAQLGIVIRDEDRLNSSETSTGNLTREDRKKLVKRLKQAQDMLASVCRAKEQYAVCSVYSEKLQKTAEFLEMYHREVNATYNAIYNIVHGQPDQISSRRAIGTDPAATLQNINETLKEQVCDELRRFSVQDTDRRDGDS